MTNLPNNAADRRSELELALVALAREIFECTGEEAVLLAIPDSHPPLFVAVGLAGDILDDLDATGSLPALPKTTPGT